MNPGSFEREICIKRQLIPYSFRAYQYLRLELMSGQKWPLFSNPFICSLNILSVMMQAFVELENAKYILFSLTEYNSVFACSFIEFKITLIMHMLHCIIFRSSNVIGAKNNLNFYQKLKLMESYEDKLYPESYEIHQLAKSLNLSETRIRTWYTLKRYKCRKAGLLTKGMEGLTNNSSVIVLL